MHVFATQCPVEEHISSTPQELGWQAGMQRPALPPLGQRQAPGGPHTIAVEAAASPPRQSESTLQVPTETSSHISQPKDWPGGLQTDAGVNSPQSESEAQVTAPESASEPTEVSLAASGLPVDSDVLQPHPRNSGSPQMGTANRIREYEARLGPDALRPRTRARASV